MTISNTFLFFINIYYFLYYIKFDSIRSRNSCNSRLILIIWKYEIMANLSVCRYKHLPPMSIFSHALCLPLPDTFASKVAATQDQYADASIGNVTGSNAVNVFLGIGVAWSVAAVYWAIQGKRFYVDPGSLAFSVTLFTVFAFVCMAALLFRRRPSIGGELGGPRVSRLLTVLLFLGLWFLYILFSSLEAYCHIEGFWTGSKHLLRHTLISTNRLDKLHTSTQVCTHTYKTLMNRWMH